MIRYLAAPPAANVVTGLIIESARAYDTARADRTDQHADE
jgi:hypothetical protein